MSIVIEESELGVIDRSNSSPSSMNRGEEATVTAQTPTALKGSASFSLNGSVGDCVDDVMTMSRIKKRLSLVESELELTKHRFSTTQASLQVGQVAKKWTIIIKLW